MPAISEHLKVLERKCLITRSRQAQFRRPQLERERLDEAVAWIDEARQLWRERLDKLDAHLRRLQDATPRRKDEVAPDEHRHRATT